MATDLQTGDRPPPRVFISYSHDSPEHCDRVLELAQQLRRDGIDAWIDQFETSPPQGWPLWCSRQILDADYVLLICTEIYRKRFLGLDQFGKGKGVKWEGKIIQNVLYYEEVSTGFIPVLLESGDELHIPETIREASWYTIPSPTPESHEYAQLAKRLSSGRTGIPPLNVPLPSQDFRQRDDASILTDEVWSSSRQISTKLDGLRRGQEEHEARSARRHRAMMWSLVSSVVVVIAVSVMGFVWTAINQVRIVADPVILRAKLEEKIEISFRDKLANLTAKNANPSDIDQLYQWRDQAEAQLDESVRFIQIAADDLKSPLIREATRQLQERGVDAALEYLDEALEEELKHHQKQTRQLAETYLFKADLLHKGFDFDAALEATDKATEIEPTWWEPYDKCGQVEFNLAHWTLAEQAFEKAETLAKDNVDRAIVLNNLATLLQATNRFSEAESMYRRALAIDERSHGSEHPNVVRDLNNLAGLLQATNRRAKAEPMFRRALAIQEKSYGADHPNVAAVLNNLAVLLEASNRFAEAEPMFRRALAIDEKSLGPDHPKVATCLNNLAGLLQATNRLSEAEPMFRRALAIDEKGYGPDHPRVAIRLNNLARLLEDTGRLAEAEPMYRRAMAIDEKSYGQDHPDVARDLNNLARLLEDTNRLTEAEPMFRQALVILLKFTRATGHEHPHLAGVLGNYESLLKEMSLSKAQIGQRLVECGLETGFDKESLGRLLGEVDSVDKVD